MAENKKGIVIYADWIDKFEALEDDEAGRLIKHFFRYVNDLNPEFPDKLTKISFLDIQNTLKRDLVKWEERAERSRLNGQKGGRPSNLNNPEKPEQTQRVILEPRKPDSVSVSGTVSDSVKVTVKEKNNINSIDLRKKEFSATLTPFLESFGKELLNDFYFYWVEPNKSKTKLKFELERTWEVKRRLNTWAKNDKYFNKNGKQNTNTLKSNNGTYDAKDFGKL